MPRIPREAHATIQQRVVGGEKVAAVAASLGCTPANIYAILAKLRRQDGGEADLLVAGAAAVDGAPPSGALTAPDPLPVATAPVVAPVTVALATPSPSEPSTTVVSAAPIGRPVQPAPTPVASSSPIAAPPARARNSSVSHAAQRPGKGGFALMMRAGDGEEAVNPFRSLEELLSAAKPILRNAARSPEPVWFSIQRVDLEALEEAL